MDRHKPEIIHLSVKSMKIIFYVSYLICLASISYILPSYSSEKEKSRVYGFSYNDSFYLCIFMKNVFKQKYQEFNKGVKIINSKTNKTLMA